MKWGFVMGFCLLLGVWAQGMRGERAERLRSLRIAVITDALELTPEEAQVFWPMYNEREASLQRHRARIQQQFYSLRAEKTTLTVQAYSDSVSALYFRLWEGEAAIRRSYHERIVKALPPQKVARLYAVELRMLRRALGEENFSDKD